MKIPLVFALLLATTSLLDVTGQSVMGPELKNLLTQMEDNRTFYSSHIPNFFCAEHVVSRLNYGSHLQHKQITITDSVFHLTRDDAAPDQNAGLSESRSQMKINGSDSAKTALEGPVVLENLFSRGLDAVSLNQSSCASYSLASSPNNHAQDIKVVNFESIQSQLASSQCVFSEYAVGRVTFDQQAKHVIRIDATIPHHQIARGYYGRWDLSVRYAPVSLGEHTYWLPQHTTSTLVPSGEDDAVWTFTADYKDFHKYEVNSRILSPSSISH